MLEEEAMVEEDLRQNSQVFSKKIFFSNILVEIVDKKEVTIRCLL